MVISWIAILVLIPVFVKGKHFLFTCTWCGKRGLEKMDHPWHPHLKDKFGGAL